MALFGKHAGGKHTTTQVGHLIDVATDAGTNSSENWTMFMEICDAINMSEEGPKDAVKAMRRKFSAKNAITTGYTLSLLETCVKNCGKRFHLHIATKDFLNDLVKVINPKNNPSMATQIMVLGLIQTWSYAFSKNPELKEISIKYHELKTKGVEFPPLDPQQASAANIPAKSTPTVAVTEVPMARANRPMPQGGNVQMSRMPPVVPQYTGPPQYQMAAPVAGGPVEMSAERGMKLRAELNTVQQNCRVFGEMLTEITPGQETQSDVELLEDLNMTCRQMQKRIMELIQSVQHEQITEDLLTVNDELNNAFLRYDRYHRLRAGQSGMQAPTDAPLYPPEPVNGYAPPMYPAAQGMPMPSMPLRAMPMPTLYDNATYSNNAPTMGGSRALPFQPRSPAVANLIDFDEASSDPTPQQEAIYSTITNFDNLNVGSADDFDALAHSRQTTQPAAQKDDFDWSESKVKESDFHEMQQWLIDNPSSSDGAAAASTESATPLEFERFLSRRQEEAQNLPPAGKKLEPIKDEPLFSL